MRLWIASFVCLSYCLVGGVDGATDCAPASGSLTIKTAQDVSDVTKCAKFTGNIVVAADGPEGIALDGIQQISGNLDVENVAKLHSLSSTSLQVVSSLTLNQLPQLSNLNFPALSNFSSLKWYNLPTLEGCTIATGALAGEVQEITIVNTSIKSLDWLVWPIGSQLNVTNNAKLTNFSIPYDSINAGSALTFSNNAALETIDLTALTGIYGGLAISNNEISTLSFPKLETIGGFVQLSGSYKNVSMPTLNSIKGALSVESTGDISALCGDLNGKNLAGHYTCNANVQGNRMNTNPGTTTSATPSSTGTATAPPDPSNDKGGDGGSGLSQPIKAGIAVAVSVLTILALVFALFYLRRRIRSKVREIDHNKKVKEIDSVELAESDSSASPRNTRMDTGLKELESPAIRLELANGKTILEAPSVVPHELDATHGRSELNTPITPVSPSASVGSVNSVTPLVRHELPA